MATSLYDLAVNVSTNTASLETGFNKIGDLIRQQTKQWQTGFDSVRSTVLNLAAGFVSVGSAIESVRRSIALGDELKQMADTTGVAVEKLDQLSIVAKLNSANLGDMAKAWKTLGSSMVEAQTATSKQAQLFSALGVATKDASGNLRSVDDVMGDVAKALAGIDNETVRAAVGTELLGKGYQAIAATLRNYKDDQEKANEILASFGNVSTRTAALADDLGDKFALLGEGSKRALLGALVPGMAAVSAGLDAMLAAGGKFQSGFGQVVSWIAEKATVAFINLADLFQKVGLSIAATAAAIATRSMQPFEELKRQIAQLEAQRQAAIASVRTASQFAGLDNSDQVSRAAAAQERLNKAHVDSAAVLRALAPAQKAVADEGDKFIASLIAQEQAIGKTKAELQTLRAIELGRLQDAAPIIRSIADKTAAEAAEKQKASELADALAKVDEQTRKMQDGYAQATASAEQLVASMQFEIDALQMTNAEREISIRLRELERLKVNLTAEEYEKFAAQIRNLGAAKETALANQNLLQGWRDFFTSVADYGAQFIFDFVEHGSSAFKRLWEDFRGWALSAFAKIAAQTLVVNIAGAFSPQLGGIASQALGGGGFNLASLFGLGGGGGGGGIGSWLSSGGIFSSGLGNAFATSGIGQALGLSTLAEFSTGSMALTTLGTTLGTVLPIIGAGLAIAAAFGAFSKGGGPKEGGTAGFQSYYPGETTAAGNTAMQQAITAIQSSYDQLVAALGGKGSAAFALGFDTDPRGTAQNRVSAAATVGGKSVYSLRDLDVGRDSATLQAELQTQAQRALLSALRASDLPKYLADILDSVNIDVASATDIQNLLAYAAAAKQAVDSIQGLGTAFAKLDPEQILAVADALGGIEAATQGFAYLQQNFTTAADKLERAQQQLTDGFEALGLEVPKTHEAFLQLVNDLIALGDAADAASVISLAGLFIEVNGTADQAAQSITTLNESLSSLDERAADLGFVITDVGAMIKEGYSQADAILGKFSQLASNAPDFGSKLSIQLTLIADALKKASPAQFSSLDGFNVYVKTLQKSQTTLTDTLARFTILSAQFDATRAEQLIGLQDWYDEQQRMFRGNTAALSAVETLFQQKWSAIVNGVAGGVDGTLDQLARLRQGIADYLKGLLISDLSPLTPQQKLEQAQSAYVETLLKAQSGDLAALGDITKYADAYLKQARDFFASSAPYSDIFASVTGQLTGLATAPTLAAPTQGDIKENTQATRDMEAALLALLTGQHAEDTALGQSQLDTLRQIAGARNRQAVAAR